MPSDQSLAPHVGLVDAIVPSHIHIHHPLPLYPRAHNHDLDGEVNGACQVAILQFLQFLLIHGVS